MEDGTAMLCIDWLGGNEGWEIRIKLPCGRFPHLPNHNILLNVLLQIAK
jgi:hypothetical protein